ncbi:MAG TPA: hypothetical protein V6D23_19575 [Candidatus Obscuribacterales bacterium]
MSSIGKACLLMVCLSGLSAGNASAAGIKTAESPTETIKSKVASPMKNSPEAKALLKQALKNTSALKTAHVEAILLAGQNRIPVHADLGIGTVDLTIERLDGITARHILVGEQEAFSTDGGKTWMPDEAHSGRTISMALTFVFTPTAALLGEEPITLVGPETKDGQESTHLRIEGGEGKSQVDIWVADAKDIGPVISRYQGVIGYNDMDLEASLEYTAFNEEVDIKIPG